MATLTPDEINEQQLTDDVLEGTPLEEEEDLSALACFAAAEVDRLMRGKQIKPMSNLSAMTERIETWIPKVEDDDAPRSLADSDIIVAMAISLPGGTKNRLDEVVADAKGMTAQLKQVLSDPTKAMQTKETLPPILEFCLQLSSSTRSIGYPPDIQSLLRQTRND